MNDDADTCLHRTLRRRAHGVTRAELARRMGYRRVDERLLARIEHVLGDTWLGLDSSAFDFRYSRDEFLVAMCDALAIDPALREPVHQRIRARVHHRNTAFRPCLFVDTGFKRRHEPIFALGLMEPRRWLGFERDFVEHDLAMQFEIARERVIAHYRHSGGHLPPWGVIQRYLFQYASDAVPIFDTDGRAIGETDAIRADRASARIGARDARALLKSSGVAVPNDDTDQPPNS
ncbi:hypothetical protein [Salinisphaera sp. T31B1]|uniref:hypothetical protein n=1 Tax=Salinisphaera sp. T31B1 TaxID=727963 RepID=UPI003340538B